MRKKLYLFDFDGTITSADSFIRFSFFSINCFLWIKYWVYVFFLFPFYPKSVLKEMYYKHFKGLDILRFNQLCLLFLSQNLTKTIKKSFLEYVESIEENSIIVVVTASISNYLVPWCNENGFDLISTELEVINGRLTGKFSTPNCNGAEKVRRIKEKYNLKEYYEIHVFGNSKGDLPMLELGTHKYYNFFK